MILLALFSPDSASVTRTLARADFEDVIKVLFLLAFFVAPAIRGVLEAIGKGKNDTSKAPIGPPSRRRKPWPSRTAGGPKGAGRGGGPTWKELMRGEIPAPSEPVPVPRAQPRSPEATRVPQGQGTFSSSESAAVPEALGIPSATADREPESVFASIPTVDLPDLDLEGGLSEIPSESELESGAEEHPLGSTWDSVFDDGEVADGGPGAVPPRSTERRAPKRARIDLRSLRGQGRRSILLAEILGPPLAMRQDGTLPGPPASFS